MEGEYACTYEWTVTPRGRPPEVRPKQTVPYSVLAPLDARPYTPCQTTHLEHGEQVVLERIRIVIGPFRTWSPPVSLSSTRRTFSRRLTVAKHLHQKPHTEVDVAQLLRTRIPLREQRVQERLPALPAIRLRNALEESTGIVVLNVGCEIQHVRT